MDQNIRYIRQMKTNQLDIALRANSTCHGKLPKSPEITKDHIEIKMATIVDLEINEMLAAVCFAHNIS